MAMRKGVSIIEVTITIVVLALIATGMVEIFSRGISTVRESRRRAIAYNLAREGLEREFVWPPTPDPTPLPVGGFPGFERQIFVTNPYLGEANLARVRVTVWWDNGNQFQSFATIKAHYD